MVLARPPADKTLTGSATLAFARGASSFPLLLVTEYTVTDAGSCFYIGFM